MSIELKIIDPTSIGKEEICPMCREPLLSEEAHSKVYGHQHPTDSEKMIHFLHEGDCLKGAFQVKNTCLVCLVPLKEPQGLFTLKDRIKNVVRQAGYSLYANSEAIARICTIALSLSLGYIAGVSETQEVSILAGVLVGIAGIEGRRIAVEEPEREAMIGAFIGATGAALATIIGITLETSPNIIALASAAAIGGGAIGAMTDSFKRRIQEIAGYFL